MRLTKLDALLEEELEWELEEQSYKNGYYDWLRRGVLLYEELLILQPEENRFRHQLIDLSYRLGTLEKIEHQNYSLAIKNLSRVIKESQIDDPLTHYRLGFIHFHLKNWAKAIQHFQFAVRKNQAALKVKIEPLQEAKAKYFSILANVQQSYHDYKRFKNESHHLTDDLSGIEYDQLLDFMEIIDEKFPVEQLDKNLHYILYKRSGELIESENLTRQEIARKRNQNSSQDLIIIDCINSYPNAQISYQAKEVKISPSYVELIKYFFLNSKSLTLQEIAKNQGIIEDSVRTKVQRLKRTLDSLDGIVAINNFSSGGQPSLYQWQSDKTCYLFTTVNEKNLYEILHA